jgi:hypothetical protein
MTRLPQDGRDAGKWGSILNDYLLIEHDEHGALRIRTDGTLPSKEDISNKSPNQSLGNSDVLYPTQRAVKTYIDTYIGMNTTMKDSFDSGDTNQIVSTTAMSGTNPTFTAQGPDAAIGMIFTSKGTGRILFRPGADATNSFSFQNAAVTSSVLNIDTVNNRVGVATVSASSTLGIAGSVGVQRTALADTNATLGIGHCYVAFSAQTAARTITLPTATTCSGRIYIISDELGVTGAFPITVTTTSAQMIDNFSTYILNANYGSVTLISTGTKWKIIVDSSSNRPAITTKATSYTANVYDQTIICNTNSNPLTITLPNATVVAGKLYVIKKSSTSANALTIQGSSGQTIDGGANVVSVATTKPAFHLQSDGTNWILI